MTDTTRWPVLTSALHALTRAADELTADDLARPTPCSAWTVAQVLEHAALDQLAWAHAVSDGRTDGPATDPFAPTGPSDVVAQVRAAVATAFDTWSRTDAAGPLGTPLPQGPLDGDAAAAACALDAAVHAWDVAVALGRPSPLEDDLASLLAPTAHAIVEPLRAYGAIGAPVPGGDGGAADSLLRFLGRNPRWSA
ncbi:DinB family protein [Jatrophihabitans fulvus]